MELTMYGFQVYTTEVDDRGIDFVTRYKENEYLPTQVKSIRKLGYVYLRKDKFDLSEDLFLALTILNEKQEPILYLIPSTAWEKPNALFVSRDYIGLESKPEWGLNLSQKNMHYLEQYTFLNMLPQLQS